MANAIVAATDTKVTLELNVREAAFILGVIGMTRLDDSAPTPFKLVKRGIVEALENAGLEERMTDFGARVGTSAVVVAFNG